MLTQEALPSSTTSTSVGLIAVVAFFCLPLFIGLGGWDLHNDESIYAYSVDRMVDIGDWLTPRSIQVDGPFLEKPPLKFWITAGLIRAGVLSHDEQGMRAVDAFFGALAFLYVFALGHRLAGIVCGLAATLVLFTLDRFVFDHGLRSHNMDAALVLAYCGGIYHFARWEDRGDRRGGRWHALAVALYFVLGFMTKFVAAFFLPLVCGVAFIWRPDAWTRTRAGWRSWVAPTLAVAALCAPWFIYQTVQSGNRLWEVILGQHVYTRFTASLDPNHLHPWHYYYTEAWHELWYDGSHWIAFAGLMMLGAKAWSGRPWLARLLFTWWALPFLLLTIGSSKLFHYAYPFLPPIAIAAGYASAVLVRVVADAIEPLFTRLRDWRAAKARAASTGVDASAKKRPAGPSPRLKFVGALGAAIAFGVAVWTIVAGNIDWAVGGWRLFRNASLVRPIVIGAAFLWLRGTMRGAAVALALLPLIPLLPVRNYHDTIAREATVRHPLRALRDCARDLRRSGITSGDGTYNAAQRVAYHSYFYYLRDLGAWTESEHPDRGELERRMTVPGAQTVAIVSLTDYRSSVLAAEASTGAADVAGRSGAAAHTAAALTVAPDEGIVLLLPGVYQPCAEKVVAAGGYRVDAQFLRESKP